MNLNFEILAEKHQIPVMEIFNHYIEHTFCAYPDVPLPEEFFERILAMAKGYPAYAVKSSEKVIGFGFCHAYNPFKTFRHTAEISYFIHQEYTGKGIGRLLFEKLEAEAKLMGIHQILASIASVNVQSLEFHRKLGFTECGRFHNIITKKGNIYDVIWMEKSIS